MINIAIFASGNGTNAENLIRHFGADSDIATVLVISNRKDAPVLERARRLSVPAYSYTNIQFGEGHPILELLNRYGVDFIVLAGFLQKIAPPILEAYPRKIVNIHPALLPKFGGKGMYGMKVHQAVVESQERESGITIHYVDDRYDAGEIIFQATCPIAPADTPEDIAKKVHRLEYRYFPEIVKKTALKECK